MFFLKAASDDFTLYFLENCINHAYDQAISAMTGIRMSSAAIGRAVVVIVGGAIMYAAGYVTSNFRGKNAREDLKKENERIRTVMDAYFAEFENLTVAMESAMADIAANPPLNAKELSARLARHGLTKDQIDRILSDLERMGIFKTGAA